MDYQYEYDDYSNEENRGSLRKVPVIVEIAAPLSSMWPKLAAVLILYADVKYR